MIFKLTPARVRAVFSKVQVQSLSVLLRTRLVFLIEEFFHSRSFTPFQHEIDHLEFDTDFGFLIENR